MLDPGFLLLYNIYEQGTRARKSGSFFMSDLICLKKSDARWFDAARKAAEKSTFPRFHVGCAVVYGNHVLSSACNSEKSDPVQKKYNHYRHFNNYNDPKMVVHSIHSEIAAIKKIPYPEAQQIDWKRVRVFVYRVATGLPRGFGMARPCRACMEYIRELGIREVYYTTDMGFAGERIM